MGVKSKPNAKNGGSLEPTVCSIRPKHFYRIGDEAFAVSSMLPISRAHTLNRDMEQSSDFVELLRLAGLGQVELHSTTPDDVDLEAGRIIAHWQKPKQSSAAPIFPQLRPLDQCNPLLVKFTEPGKLPERPEGMRILMALEVKFLSRSALPLKSEAPTAQVDARLRSATTYNKCPGPLNFMDICNSNR